MNNEEENSSREGVCCSGWGGSRVRGGQVHLLEFYWNCRGVDISLKKWKLDELVSMQADTA